jgi:glycosyltransferase involved in cell wall biosynthesis
VPHIAREHIPNSTEYRKKDDTFTLLFFGNFAYQPNQHGLQVLLENIVPLLVEKAEFAFRVVIFGKNLPEFASALLAKNNLPIEFLGFIEDFRQHIQAADIVINPVCLGAGVQTKIIDALSLGTTVISAQSGARGIVIPACGEKLLTVPNGDWASYVEKVIEVKNDMRYLSPTPQSFFSIYSEEAVMTTVLDALNFVKR